MHEAVVDAFVEKLAAEASALKLGHGLDAGTGIGPLIDEAATFKCQERVKGAVAMGAAVVCGGNKPPGPGSFFEPTVVRDVAQQVLRQADIPLRRPRTPAEASQWNQQAARAFEAFLTSRVFRYTLELDRLQRPSSADGLDPVV